MTNIQIAAIPVQLDNRFPDLALLCRGYETEETPILRISVSQEEIETERQGQNCGFSDGYLETVCMYRKLALEMLRYNVFIMHASVIEVDGAGYAFLAHSGTGKTTQTLLWLRHFGDRARVINGDKPLIRLSADGTFVAYGTPWCGKEGLGCNASVPLKALFLLERATEPSCEPAAEEYCIDRIFHQLLMPEHPEQMLRLLTMADRLIETVPCYRLRCDMTDASVAAAYGAAQNT